MSRMYVASMDHVSVTAVCELFYIAAPSDAVVRIHEIKITQDEGETSEQLPLRIFRTATDQTGKGTLLTGRPLSVGDTAFGGEVITTILTGATFAAETTMLLSEAQNILNGFHILPTPECRIELSPSGKLVVKLDAAPSATLYISGYMIFEEIGG